MRVTIDGISTQCSDLCETCAKDNSECVLKKALNNYHGGGDIPLTLMLMDCPEYIRTRNRNTGITWSDFDDRVCATLNPNATVRLNTEIIR